CGSSNCGVATSGVDAAVAGRKGSPEGPASAGAIVVAVSAAIISSAERKEANIPTVDSAANHLKPCACYFANTTEAPLVIPRLAWHFSAFGAQEMPPALVVGTGVTRPGR